MKKPVQMWVYPDFKNKLKIKSAELNIPMFKLTKELSSMDDIEDYFKNGNKKFKI